MLMDSLFNRRCFAVQLQICFGRVFGAAFETRR